MDLDYTPIDPTSQRHNLKFFLSEGDFVFVFFVFSVFSHILKSFSLVMVIRSAVRKKKKNIAFEVQQFWQHRMLCLLKAWKPNKNLSSSSTHAGEYLQTCQGCQRWKAPRNIPKWQPQQTSITNHILPYLSHWKQCSVICVTCATSCGSLYDFDFSAESSLFRHTTGLAAFRVSWWSW